MATRRVLRLRLYHASCSWRAIGAQTRAYMTVHSQANLQRRSPLVGCSRWGSIKPLAARALACCYSSPASRLPPHSAVQLPALSPTMEVGSVVGWEKGEGQWVEEGDVLLQVETDKATMEMEAPRSGYLARILLPTGTRDIPLGKTLCVFTENEEDVPLFKDYQGEEGTSEETSTLDTAAPPPAPPPASAPSSASRLPPHSAVQLPALSPTMEAGSVVGWEKGEGQWVEEGDVLLQVETDKATMEMEAPRSGYLARILLPTGTRDIPLGKVLCVMTDSEEDVPAFKDYQDTSTSSDQPAPVTSAPATPPDTPSASQPGATPPASATPPSPAGRVFASPYARMVAVERGVDLSSIVQGSGYAGLVTSRDVVKATPFAPPTAGFTDIPLTGMRKTIATRLVQSKSTVPHYYLTMDVNMGQILSIRRDINAMPEQTKLSVNDFIVKASAVALGKVPEANSSWMDTAIRRYHSVDISVAVSTDGGLITPIVFRADQKSLSEISGDIRVLAQKAKEGRLQPQEFQGGTFTVSNLGMFGVSSFTAIINPPQSCILAVGATRRSPVADQSQQGCSMGDVMSVTLCCDHRVVDGAVGAAWLAAFRRTLEQPYTMLL